MKATFTDSLHVVLGVIIVMLFMLFMMHFRQAQVVANLYPDGTHEFFFIQESFWGLKSATYPVKYNNNRGWMAQDPTGEWFGISTSWE